MDFLQKRFKMNWGKKKENKPNKQTKKKTKPKTSPKKSLLAKKIERKASV